VPLEDLDRFRTSKSSMTTIAWFFADPSSTVRLSSRVWCNLAQLWDGLLAAMKGQNKEKCHRFDGRRGETVAKMEPRVGHWLDLGQPPDQSRRPNKVTRKNRRMRKEIALTIMTVPRALRRSESVVLMRPYLIHQRMVMTGTAYLMKTKPAIPASPRKGKKIRIPKESGCQS
jgi:hypothetical protein